MFRHRLSDAPGAGTEALDAEGRSCSGLRQEPRTFPKASSTANIGLNACDDSEGCISSWTVDAPFARTVNKPLSWERAEVWRGYGSGIFLSVPKGPMFSRPVREVRCESTSSNWPLRVPAISLPCGVLIKSLFSCGSLATL